ncbi:MAG: MBL fold metallo-hydrolase [Nakamurella sp.]
MFITGFPAGPLAANCYVVAPDSGDECVVIDTGQQVLGSLRAVLAQRGLRPAAILLTHGHFDHVASAAAASAEYGADVYIGGGDVGMLSDPLSALSEQFRAMIPQFLAPGESLDNLRPARLTPLAGGEILTIGGVTIDVLAVPGHTPGSLTYRIAGSSEILKNPGYDGPDLLFTGDTLFAGSIGRTDLPGGSTSYILESIGTTLLSLPDDTVVLPGHGPGSTIGDERRTNPFLAELR